MEYFRTYWDVTRHLMMIQRKLPPLKPVADKNNVPLTVMQQRLWYIDQLAPDNTAYNMVASAQINGNLDIEALEKTINEIINRHEILRVTFKVINGVPSQVINEHKPIKINYVDLSNENCINKEEKATQILTDDCQKIFKLSEGPLIRVITVKEKSDKFYFQIVTHHIVVDGWSIVILYDELNKLYKQFTNGEPAALNNLPVQYSDYAIWHQQNLKSEIIEQQLQYWKEKLSNYSDIAELPSDRPRQQFQTFKGKHFRFAFSEELSKKLKDLTLLEEGLTLFMVLLAAFKVIIYRYSGNPNVSIGSPIGNRNRKEIRDLIGFFVQTMILNTDLSNNPTFRELLSAVKNTCLGAYANQDLPFEQLVDELQSSSESGYKPLFHIMFTYQNIPIEDMKFGDLAVEPFRIERNGAMFDLVLSLTYRNNAIYGYFEYNEDLFNLETIENLKKHFDTLLTNIVENPDQRICHIPILDQAEQMKIVRDWNNTEAAYSSHLCIHQLFEQKVLQQPDHEACVYDNQKITYQQLNEKANQVAHFLIKKKIKLNDYVGIYMERSIEMIIVLLGILKSGAAYLPLEPSYPIERLSFMMKESKLKLLFTQKQLDEKLASINDLQKIYIDTNLEFCHQENTDNPAVKQSPDNIAYTIYTSGSTGTPKGVVVAHKPVINLIEWVNKTCHISKSDKLLFITSLCFDLSVYDIFGMLAAGGTIYIPQEKDLHEPQQLLMMLLKWSITFWDSAPAALAQLVPFLSKIPADANTCNLKHIFLSGDWIPVNLPDTIRAVFINVEMMSLGGATEAVIWSNYYPIKQVDPSWKSIPYGKPIQNARYYILDDFLQPCPVNIPGNLYIGGECLALGYLNRPELTAERFIPDFIGGKKGHCLYFTGDRAKFWPDGNIEFLGRNDKQVKIRGFRIELGEIENVLRKYNKIKQTLVTVNDDIFKNRRLIAYYMTENNEEISAAELKSFISHQLPDYMIPSFFIKLEMIPLTANGKINFSKLPVPNLNERDINYQFVAPETQMEIDVAKIWSDALGVNKISLTDNFFDLGGHSLNGIQILSKIQEKFKIELSFNDFFKAETVADLVQLISKIENNTFQTNDKIDFKNEVHLDPAINMDNVSFTLPGQLDNILLIGATGFLGSYLLVELLEETQVNIHCLIRGKDHEEAIDRIKRACDTYHIWKNSYKNRIIPVIGDISLKKFGLNDDDYDKLSNTIDFIYHCGAWVNFLLPYQTLKAVNVQGTEEILRFVIHKKVKILHYMSTLSVLIANVDYKTHVFYEDSSLSYSDMLLYEDGYTQSKWVSESIVELAQERGLPVNIYRLGNITGHTQSGICNPNDFIWRIVKGCVLVKSAPIFTRTMDMVPIDYVIKAIVHISKQPDIFRKHFHLYNANSIEWPELIKWMNSYGYPVDLIDYQEWRKKVIDYIGDDDKNDLSFLLHLLGEEAPPPMEMPKVSYEFTANTLKGTSIHCQPVNDDLLKSYFSHFIKSNYLPSPKTYNPAPAGL